MTHLNATSFSDYARKKFEESMKKVGWEPTLPNSKLWAMIPNSKSKENRTFFAEAERWFDVREIGIRIYGPDRFEAKEWKTPIPVEPPRFQLRWVGSAAGLNDLRKQWRYIRPGRKVVMDWKEMGDFETPPKKVVER